MPNGDSGHLTLLEHAKLVEDNYESERNENSALRAKVKKLEKERDALKQSIKIIKEK